MKTLLSIIAAAVGSTSLAVDADAQGKSAAAGVRLRSTYQHTPLNFNMKGTSIRQLTINGELKDGRIVSLSLDPNTCTLNQFGDPSICTLIAPVLLKVKLTQLRVADRAKPPRKLFRVESARFGKGLNVYLVVPKGDVGYRLVLDRPATKSRVVVALEKRKAGKVGKPRVSK